MSHIYGMLRKTKSAAAETDQADPLAPSPEFTQALQRWRAVSEKRTELLDRVDGLKFAISVGQSSESPDMPDNLRVKAEPFLATAHKRPQRAQAALEDAEDEFSNFLPKYFAESDAFKAAQRRETNRIAMLLQPRHREAVMAMVAAVEDLSRAIAAEREVRQELRERAPLPESATLPDFSSELGLGCIYEPGGIAWRWVRRLRKIGLIKD